MEKPKQATKSRFTLTNPLANFLKRVRALPSFWQTKSSQQKPSWFDNPRLVKPYRDKRKRKLKTKRAMRRARLTRGQNLRTGRAS